MDGSSEEELDSENEAYKRGIDIAQVRAERSGNSAREKRSSSPPPHHSRRVHFEADMEWEPLNTTTYQMVRYSCLLCNHLMLFPKQDDRPNAHDEEQEIIYRMPDDSDESHHEQTQVSEPNSSSWNSGKPVSNYRLIFLNRV